MTIDIKTAPGKEALALYGWRGFSNQELRQLLQDHYSTGAHHCSDERGSVEILESEPDTENELTVVIGDAAGEASSTIDTATWVKDVIAPILTASLGPGDIIDLDPLSGGFNAEYDGYSFLWEAAEKTAP